MSQYDEIAPDVVSPHDSKATPDQPLKHLDTVIALYDFPGTQPSHLPLNLGDTVFVLSKSATGWWDGVVIANTEIQRGWFPNNYVRSVNYVQPILNKLKSNKEIDSITAANTAANVLIPSFTNLLQRTLLDSERNSSGTTRKNSVVSFASSETSIPETPHGTPQPAHASPQHPVSIQIQIQNPAQQSHGGPNVGVFGSPDHSIQSHSSQSSTHTHSSFHREATSISTTGVLTSSALVTLDEAEDLAEGYKAEFGLALAWIPRYTADGNYVFYSEHLDVYCETPPFVRYSETDFPENIAVPTVEAIDDSEVILLKDTSAASAAPTALGSSSSTDQPIASAPTALSNSGSSESAIPMSSELSGASEISATSEVSAISGASASSAPSVASSQPSQPPTSIRNLSTGAKSGSASSTPVAFPRSNSSLDPLKRDSNASFHTQTSTSSYHHFSQPFFAMDNLFYKSPTDLTRWSEMQSSLIYLLDLSLKAVKEQNKQLFGTHFFRLNKLISVLFIATRLAHDDFVDSKYEKSVRRKLKRIGSSFAQVYINGILHLSIMHHQVVGEQQLFGFDISRFSRVESEGSVGSSTSTIRGEHAFGSIAATVAASSAAASIASAAASISGPPGGGPPEITYLDQITLEINSMKQNITSVIKIFVKLTSGKVVRRSDYDSSDASGDDEDEGQDRHDILPQVYPRFIVDEFNGGNWCNPFFSTKNPVLNVSGDDLKNRYHSKIIIDHQAYASVCHYTEEMTKLSKETLEYLDPSVQHLYFNESLKGERNTQILRLIYKYLYHASSMVDLIESFDFTVFCLIKRYGSVDDEDKLRDQLKSSEKKEGAVSSLTFDYPVVLEFFQNKQQFHDLILNIIMATQALTLEDPEVFKGLKEDDPLFYNRDVLKIPTEKASLLLTNILSEQLNERKGNHISLNPDTLMSRHIKDGIAFFDVVLTIIQQLIDERETILNYATRVMHDDFNVQLLVMERNNTILSEKSDEGPSYYSGGQNKKSNDVPWYLEGDEEYDLLLDLKGNIKGGTKEALVAHLTHHDLFDSNFNSAFLFSFATMFSLGEFIGMLINRFDIEAPEGLSFEEYNLWISKKQNHVRLRVMNIMKLLLEKYWSDSYYNEAILKRWLSFASTSAVQAYSVGKQISNDLTRLLNGEKICVEREPVIPSTKPPAVLFKSASLIKKMKLLDIDYVELARQLTYREFNLYSKINKFACLAKVWGKKSGITESIESISSFIKASNQLTNFVAYMILRKSDIRKRVQIIRYFVQVAEKCRQFNNFSSMTAIISALYSSPIHRLKKTWKYLNTETMSQLQNMNKLMNSSRNFNEYRDVLKFIGSEPCVPFFGVYLSDLTFVYHGNPDFLMNRIRMINFAKRAKTFEIVSGIDRFKTMGFNFTPVAEIQKFVDSWFGKCPTIEEQYQLSLNLESREAVQLQTAQSNAQVTAQAVQAAALQAQTTSRSSKSHSTSFQGLKAGPGSVSSSASSQPHHSSSNPNLYTSAPPPASKVAPRASTTLTSFTFK